MGNISLNLALLLLCLCTRGILAVPITTIKPINEVHTEKSAKNEIIKPVLAPESRSNVDNASEEDLDGRSAYINNRYVADEDMDEDIEQNQPLYEILQKQMEHVLAATGPDVPHYAMENGDDNTSDELKHDSLQRPPNKPIFELQNEEDVDDYPEDELDGEDIDGQETASQEESEETAPQSTTTSTNKPKTTKRKQTVIIMRSTKGPHRVKTTSTTSTTSKSATATTTTTTELPTTTTSTTSTTTTERPITSSSTTSTPPPTTTTTTHKPKQQSPIPASSIYPTNTDVYNHKRRIIFKTISTGSQFVHSPIGDLMIKFSIGLAKPPPAHLAARSSASVNEALKTLSGSLIKQLNANALHKKHKRVKKSQNGEKIY